MKASLWSSASLAAVVVASLVVLSAGRSPAVQAPAAVWPVVSAPAIAAKPQAPGALPAPALPGAQQATSPARKNLLFSYYLSSATGIQPWEIQGDKVSHVIWAFANMLEDGTVTLQSPPEFGGDNVAKLTKLEFGQYDKGPCNCKGECLKGELYQMYLLKRRHPHLKVLLSVGGWTWSHRFSIALRTESGRKRAAETATALLEEYGFDGFDIDWEFPATRKEAGYSVHDHDHYFLGLTLAEIKAVWNKTGNKNGYILTAALAGILVESVKYKLGWQLIAQHLDLALIMSYEFQHTQGRTRSGSALYAVADDNGEEQLQTVDVGLGTYLNFGFPKEKLVMGVPLYGSGWNNLNWQRSPRDDIPGYGLPIHADGALVNEKVPYNQLIRKLETEKWVSTFDPRRITQSYWNGNTAIFIDSVKTVTAKADYISRMGFAGLMLWNTNQDVLDKKYSLTEAIAARYPVDIESGKRTTPFCVPNSSFCNIRCDYKPRFGTVGFGLDEFAKPLPKDVVAREARESSPFTGPNGQRPVRPGSSGNFGPSGNAGTGNAGTGNAGTGNAGPSNPGNRITVRPSDLTASSGALGVCPTAISGLAMMAAALFI